MQVIHPGGDVHWVREAAEVPCNGHNYRVQRAACRLLAELAGGKTEHMAMDAEAAHVLVAAAQARARVAAIDESVDPRDCAVPVYHRALYGPEHTAAPGKNGEVASCKSELQVKSRWCRALARSAAEV